MVKQVQSTFVRCKEARVMLGGRSILERWERAGWLRPVRRGKRLTLFKRDDIEAEQLPAAWGELVVSESIEEAMAITSTKTVPDAIQELHRLGCQNVVLINKSREVTYSDRQKIETKVVPVESVIDRCGATECLETWIGLSLIRQKSLAEGCEEAILAMAYSLSRMGGHHSTPRRSDIRMGRGHTRGFASI